MSAAAVIAPPPGLTQMINTTSIQPNIQFDDSILNKIDLLPEQSTTELFDIADVCESDWSKEAECIRTAKTNANYSLQSSAGSYATLCELIQKAKDSNCSHHAGSFCLWSHGPAIYRAMRPVRGGSQHNRRRGVLQLVVMGCDRFSHCQF